MFLSLRWRLLFMSLAVALIAVACVGLLSKNFTQMNFRTFLTKSKEADLKQFEDVLLESYRQNGGWKEAQNVLERITQTTESQLILVDDQNRIIAASPPRLLTTDIKISPQHQLEWTREENNGSEITATNVVLNNLTHVTLKDPTGTPIATLYTAQLLQTTKVRNEGTFESALNRTLILAALFSAILAMLVAVILSRRIIRPLEKLTKAVRLMESGDFSQRVTVASKDEIGELARAFNLMTESLVRAERLRRNLVSDVAHELRTPLTNIRCHIETIQDGLAQPTPEMIDSLHEEAMLLNRLVDDLQDLALAESGQLNLKLERVSVKEMIDSALKAAQPQNSKKLSIETEIQPDCSDPVVDIKRIGQVWRNILNNAILHTPVTGRITIRAAQKDSQIEFVVEDTGSGIAEKDLPYVFERFYRSDASRDRATGGIGLGLAIVRQIVSAHGGQARIESRIDEGTKFYFTLPVEKH